MYKYKAFVTRVIDGDTYEVSVDLGFGIKFETTLRLYGIDTPETWRPKTKAEKHHGERAKAIVKSMIENKDIEIKTHSTGKYGRYLCEVFTSGGIDLIKYLRDHELEKKENYDCEEKLYI